MNAIYARQSVDKGDSLSIQGQIDLCARQIGGDYQVYADKGYSGKNTHRPAFSRLLEDIGAGRVDKVWVYRLDRFSRSIVDFGRLWALLEARGVAFESVSEKFDTSTPGGRAMLNIVMTFAQLERETTAQRVRDSYYQRLAAGAWPGGPPPWGYRLDKRPAPDGRPTPTLTPDEHSELVAGLFRAYPAEGASLGTLARGLTQAGIPGVRGRRGWDSAAVSRVLKNPVYVQADAAVWLHFAAQGVTALQPPQAFDGRHGCHLVGKRTRGGGQPDAPRLSLGNHPGLIPAPLWLACQDKLARNRQLPRPERRGGSWLGGLLKCKQCGYAVKVTPKGEGFYLHCSGRANLGLCRASLSLDLRALEGAVAATLGELLADLPPQPAADGATLAPLREVEGRMQALVAALSRSTPLTAPYLEGELARLEGERQALLAAAPTQASPGLDFAALPPAEKRAVAPLWIRKILLEEDRAEVWWQV